ncbi:hypothetical protein J7K74_03715, partial [Candidatus Woesearchaeota archaeon]|nr:hypothetical protein [Candidatus Woesearchaeota archaeon]
MGAIIMPKTRIRTIIVIFILILILDLAQGIEYEINSAKLFSGSREITSIRSGQALMVSIITNISMNPDLVELYINAENLSSLQFKRTTGWRSPNCAERGNYTLCTMNAWLYITSDDIPSITLKFVNKSNSSDISIETESFDITIDNDKPIVERILIDNCEKDCYVNPRLKRFVVEVSNGPVSHGEVYVSLNNRKIKVINCTDTRCEGFITIPSCSEGSQLLLKVINPSRDDAGNFFDYRKGNPRLLVKCDPNPPIIKEINITSDNTISEKEFVAGNSVKVKVIVEDYSKPRIEINASDLITSDRLIEGQCTETGNQWECQASFTITREGPYTGKIKIRAIDRAGNEEEVEEEINVNKGVERIIPKWGVQDIEMAPSKLPLVLVTTTGYEPFLEVRLSNDQGLSIVKVEPSSCLIQEAGENKGTCFIDNIFI